MSQRTRRAASNRVIIESDEEDEVEQTQVVSRKASPSSRTAQEKGKRKAVDAPSTSKRKASSQKDEGDYTASQSQPAHDISAEEKEELVANFMRYVLAQDSQKLPAKRDDIVKNILSKDYSTVKNWVIEQSKQRFRDVFGYELVEIKKIQKSAFILRNLISQERLQQFGLNNLTDLEKQQRGLLMTILGMILISNHVLDQDSIYDQLKRLGIREQEPHPIFGDWEKLIDVFVKQLYLEKRKSQNRSRTGKAMYEFKIGPRAMIELGKKRILEFVSSIYGEQVDPVQLKALELEDKEEEQDGMEGGDEDEVQGTQSSQAQSQVPSSQTQRTPPAPRRTLRQKKIQCCENQRF